MQSRKRLLKISILCLLVSFITNSSFSLSLSANIEDNPVEASRNYWMNMARGAWRAFEVDTGVGFHGSSAFTFSTDWDVGYYIQAVIDAERLGLINSTGAWGGNDRFDRVLTYLEKRPVSAIGIPYLSYDTITMQNATNIPQVATDAGKLFVALHNLREFKPELKDRIDNYVYNQTDYTFHLKTIGNLFGYVKTWRGGNVYDSYVVSGFSHFWPNRFSSVTEEIVNFTVSQPTVDYGGVVLPKVKVSCDPLLMVIFDFENPDVRLVDLMNRTYMAHEVRYNMTGVFSAFGEGSSGLNSHSWVWEWVVLPDGRMWVVQDTGIRDQDVVDVDVSPVIYLKTAVGFLALYGTVFAQDMVDYVLERVPLTSKGFSEGVDENGRLVTVPVSTANSLVVNAALYAIENKVLVPDPLRSPVSASPAALHVGNQVISDSPVNGAAPRGTSCPETTPKPTDSTAPNIATPTVDNQNNGQSSSDSSSARAWLWVLGISSVVVIPAVIVCRGLKKMRRYRS